MSKIILGKEESQGQIGLITYKLTPKVRERPIPDQSLAMITLTLNEDQYIEEWVDFHHALGAEHFYIYDQNYDSRTKKILSAHIDSGLVTLIPWPDIWGISSQTLAYAHAISSYWSNHRWMTLTDIDEFLFPSKATLLTDALREFSNYSAIYLKWRCFGPSGHIYPPSDYVIRSYTQMSKPPTDTKMLYDLTRIKAIIDPSKCGEVRTHGSLVEGLIKYYPESIYLNHYITRSESEFALKISKTNPWLRGKVYESWRTKRIKQFEYLKENWVEDRSIARVDPFD
jgi:hypothetical protein